MSTSHAFQHRGYAVDTDFSETQDLRHAQQLAAAGLGPHIYCADPNAPHDQRHPASVASEQIVSSLEAMDRDESAFFRFPFTAVDRMTGAIPPGEVWYICAFSGGGKTAFLTSLIDKVLARGERVYVMPLESQPNVFRTHLACKRLGLHAGMMLTGQYRREMDPVLYQPLRARVMDAIMAQQHGDMAERLYVSPVKHVTTRELDRSMAHAASLGATLYIVDHIDHAGDDEATNEFAERMRIQNRLLQNAQRFGLHALAASQLNNEFARGDRLAMYQPPQAHHVYGGGKKRQVASGMLGLYRPLRFDPPTREELAMVREGSLEPWRVLEPNCMGVLGMKLRSFGEREWDKVFLLVEDGCVSDMPPRDIEGTLHGIRSQRSVL